VMSKNTSTYVWFCKIEFYFMLGKKIETT